MSSTNWQRERNATRQPHLARLQVGPATPCQACEHVRSSHSLLVLNAPCRVDGCTCPQFDPICGCGHLLTLHQWGTSERPWACSQCVCRHFGAVQEVLTLDQLLTAQLRLVLDPDPEF